MTFQWPRKKERKKDIPLVPISSDNTRKIRLYTGREISHLLEICMCVSIFTWVNLGYNFFFFFTWKEFFFFRFSTSLKREFLLFLWSWHFSFKNSRISKAKYQITHRERTPYFEKHCQPFCWKGSERITPLGPFTCYVTALHTLLVELENDVPDLVALSVFSFAMWLGSYLFIAFFSFLSVAEFPQFPSNTFVKELRFPKGKFTTFLSREGGRRDSFSGRFLFDRKMDACKVSGKGNSGIDNGTQRRQIYIPWAWN